MDLSALTVQQLRYLVAVDRLRSFRDAASACHVSQPALSMQVKRLEEILGVPIFDRSRQPVVVTEVGTAILAQARLALDHFDRIGALVRFDDELAGTFHLGFIPTLVPALVPLVLPRLSRAHPRADVEIVELRTADMVRALREGRLDAGVAATPLDVSGVHERVLCHEAFYVYLPEGHSLLGKSRIRQSDLVDEQVWLLSEGHCFRNQVLHLCSVDRSRPADGCRVRFDGGSFATLAAIVDEGVGVTILPELTVRALPPRQAARVRPFVAPEPVREVSLLYAREQARAKLTTAVFEAVQAALPPDLVGRNPRPLSVLRPLAETTRASETSRGTSPRRADRRSSRKPASASRIRSPTGP
jgi:LysR family hydrogen peroxide-inducible transcriptional activator